MKTIVKNALITLLIKFLEQYKVRRHLEKLAFNGRQRLPEIANEASPYFEYNEERNEVCMRDDIVFITSRFRSGSTVLWNVFRSLEDCTAYYEPFNERQWFNTELRGVHVDSSHLGVEDYSKEYDNLDCLSKYYEERWIDTSLLMDEDFWDPAMESYVSKLIENSPRRPVLQFNRIDFRLPWFKKHFPNAKLLHLYRNPRDQWCSFLKDKNVMNKNQVQHTYVDAFYLDVWCQDLVTHFPFLSESITPHPYQRFYYLWKLSFLCGKNQSDISINFESLTSNPEKTLTSIFTTLGIDTNNVTKAAAVIEQPELNKWKSYADGLWFEEHEAVCEKTLRRFLAKRSNNGSQ